MMSNNLDLTHLTPEEVEHLHAVLSRAQEVENKHNVKQSTNNASSHLVFQSTWSDTHGVDIGSYQSGTDIIRAALHGDGSDEKPKEMVVHVNVDKPPRTPSPVHSDPTTNSVPIDLSSNLDKVSNKSSASGINTLDEESISKSSPKKFDTSSNYSDSKATTPSKKVTFVGPTNAVNEEPLSEKIEHNKSDEEDRDILSPLKPKSDGPTSPKNFDTKSMVSRTSIHPHDFVGEIHVILIYYPPEKIQLTQLPLGRSTRMRDDNHVDVLTRKTYAALSGSRIRLTRDSQSGAKPDDDGELHLIVKDASSLSLPSGMSSRKPRTYVKCYLLPDRYHGSKMRSDVVKNTVNPTYNHKFVFRGFSKEEFKEKAIEVVVGGIASSRGRHLVVGGIRLSSGNKNAKISVPWRNSNEEEISLWNEAFEMPCTETEASLVLRARIKLTYK